MAVEVLRKKGEEERRFNMTKKGHTEEQIIAALKQHESGDKTQELCCKLGIEHRDSLKLQGSNNLCQKSS